MYLLRLVGLQPQIQSLINKLQINNAFDLLERNLTPAVDSHEERRARLHIAAGTCYLDRGRLPDAFHHFTNASTLLDCRELIVPFFPHLLAPSAAPYAPTLGLTGHSKRFSLGLPPDASDLGNAAGRAGYISCVTDNFCSVDFCASPTHGPCSPAGSASPLPHSGTAPDTPTPGGGCSSGAGACKDSPGSPGKDRPPGTPRGRGADPSLYLGHEANMLMIRFLQSKSAPEREPSTEQQAVDYGLLWLYLTENLSQVCGGVTGRDR